MSTPFRPLLKLLLFFGLLMGFRLSVSAQANNIRLLTDNQSIAQPLQQFLRKGETVQFNTVRTAEMLQAKPSRFQFEFVFENKNWVIELEAAAFFSPGFFVTTGTAPSEQFNYQNLALHFKGRIKNDPKSFAAVSILPNKMIAVIADAQSNIVIGALATSAARTSGEHIIYRDNDLLIDNQFVCHTPQDDDSPVASTPPFFTNQRSTNATVNTEPVDVYFEADHTTFLNNGASVTNTVNYVTALFNVVHTLYENDSIETKISAIKVWDVADPYATIGSSSGVLNAFSYDMRKGFPGDLAHFLSQRSLGGGIAFLNVLCAGFSVKTAVSGNLNNAFNPFPTYSWSTMVIAHEMGHNVGSPHTQSCTWPGGALDNCYATEGGCPPGSPPVNGGTIMSYCHLTANGINLANGFGPLPGALMRSRVRNTRCISPGVYFDSVYFVIKENEVNIDNGCRDYKLVTANVKIPYTPTQPATVTLTPRPFAGLEIGENKDISISPVSFTLGGNGLSQTVQFKVFDDGLVESWERLDLDLNVIGGNAVKSRVDSLLQLFVLDDEYEPTSKPDQLFYYEPFDQIAAGANGGWTQRVIHGNGNNNRWMIGDAQDPAFTGKALYVSNNGNTPGYSGSSSNDSTIVRIESPTLDARYFRDMRIFYNYKCNGEGGSDVTGGQSPAKDFGKLLCSVDNGASWITLVDNISRTSSKAQQFWILPASANYNSQVKLAFQWQNNSSVVNQPPFIIDSIIIFGTSISSIQTTMEAGNVAEVAIGPYQTVHCYNTITKNVICTIQNESNIDYGCTTVELIRTGTGTAHSWGDTTQERMSLKAFRITPTNTATVGLVKVSFYLTDAEVNGWLQGTQNQLTDMRIVKTAENITHTPPQTFPVFSQLQSRFLTNYANTPHKIISDRFYGFGYFALSKEYQYYYERCNASVAHFWVDPLPGNTYRWQVDEGNGYIDVVPNSYYMSATEPVFTIFSPPNSITRYKYRCLVTGGTPAATYVSTTFSFKIVDQWRGVVNSDWSQPGNWNCTRIPDEFTDVTIPAGTPFSPVVNVPATARSLKLKNNAQLSINPGINLTIKK
jgi:hypothetical protein